ncbi:MAG: Flp family type IVb pilin [Burkholderiaceae bacterium]
MDFSLTFEVKEVAMSGLTQWIKDFTADEEGASASEYAILVAVVVVVVYAAVRLFDLGNIFTTVSTKVKNCVNATGSTCS